MSIERVERKDGTAVWRVRWRQGGRNRSKVLGRKRDAEAFDAELVRRKRTGELAQLDAGKEPLADFGEEWWRLYGEPNLARSTLNNYASMWDTHVLPRLGSVPLRELTPDLLTRFRLELEADGVGPASVRKSLVLLQGVLQRACEWGRIPANPAAIVRKPLPPRARAVVVLAPDRVEEMRHALLAVGRIRDATLVSVLAYAGLRPGEALALPWPNVRARTLLVNGAVSLGSIADTKTRRSRTVTVLAPLAQDLAEVAAARRPPGGRARLPRPRRRAMDADGVPQLAPPDLHADRSGRGHRAPTPIRPAPLLRLPPHRRGPQHRRGRPPGRPLADDGARHLRARLRGVRPDRARQRRRPHPQRPRGAPLPRPAVDPLRRRMTAALDTYGELRHAEGKLLRWGERSSKSAVALQPRDLEILVALARYRFLTTGQIAELWWDRRGLRAVRRRMTRLFEAAFVERFRPHTLRGSYQWTYCLARDGFRAAEQTGELPPNLKFAPRREAIFDYRYVIHDLLVNEWVLRYRDLISGRLLDWAGPDESLIRPPKGYSAISEHDAIGIEDDAVRPIQPDARLDIEGGSGEVSLYVEYDRTRRVDKNYDKFRRYEAFLTGWWQAVMPEGSRQPAVVFICQDASHCDRFLDAADWQLTAYRQRWADLNPISEFVARDRVLFAIEDDMRTGQPGALRLPHHPPRVHGRDDELRSVWLPSPQHD